MSELRAGKVRGICSGGGEKGGDRLRQRGMRKTSVRLLNFTGMTG